MAAFTGKAAGNWTAAGQTTWNEVGTPVAGDTVDLNGFAVVMDVTALPVGGGTITSLTTGVAGGQLTVDLAGLGNSAIDIATMTAAAGTVLIAVSGTTANTFTVTGNVDGGTNNLGHGCIEDTTTAGVLTITGNLTGGSVDASVAVRKTGGGTLNVTGNVTAGVGSAHGIEGGGTINVTGNVSGGTGDVALGIHIGSAATLSITNGLIKGGSGRMAYGINALYNSYVTLTNCNLEDGTGGIAYVGRPPAWEITANANYHKRYVGDTPLSAPNTYFAIAPLQANVKLDTVIYTGYNGTLAAGVPIIGGRRNSMIGR